MVLFVLHKLILQKCMPSHPMGLEVCFLVELFIYFHMSCVWTAKALARLRGWADSPEPSLVAYVISTIISWAGSFVFQDTVAALQALAKFAYGYRKIPKNWDTQKIYYNHPKIQTKWLYQRVIYSKEAEGMANSVDPDQEQSDLGLHCLSRSFCQKNLGSLRYSLYILGHSCCSTSSGQVCKYDVHRRH